MANESQTSSSNVNKALAELAELRQFAGAPKDFWPRFLAAMQVLTLADHLVVLARKPGAEWRRILNWPAEAAPSSMLTTFSSQVEAFANRGIESGAVIPLEDKPGRTASNFVLVSRLDVQQNQDECAVVGLVSEVSEAQAREALLRLRLAAATPNQYQTNLSAHQSKADVEKFASVLDLTLSFSAETHFLATAFAFCNGLATRFNCDRVSLGWINGGYIKLQAISRTEKFDRQMAAAKALEVAMEESFDQDDEVIWPAWEGSAVITRDHEKFADEQKSSHVCSLPLRRNQEPMAVVTCERKSAPFTPAELQQMRLACDLASPRLADLHEHDRWFGARWAAEFRRQSGKIIGPEHTWAKVTALLIMVALALLFFLRVPYRVEGNFVLRSDELAYLSAPFDGYIDEVFARPGDAVAAGAPLLKFKTAELELEESFALADLNRYQREAEKARAARSLAEMRISEAMADQAKARLDMAKYHASQAVVKSPFAGVVVEGDLRERLGAPVKMADVLFKVAKLDTLYVEAEVNERDIQEILGKTTGEIAFVTDPRHKYPVHIVAIEPAAVPKNEANVFLVRCALDGGIQPWWRPGMSGVCKFQVEKRSLFWILTHRTVDFFRMKLWW
jgi:biotin carboxyl carrier protein